MTSIVVRTDGSLSIGSGHVMRCRTLGLELQRLGAEVTFLCRRQPGDLIDLLQTDFPVIILPQLPLVRHDGLVGRNIYRAWLGCTQNQDATDSLKALKEAGINAADWLVVDHYGIDSHWEAQVLVGLDLPKVLVIDDLADRTHLADLLLDQNFFGAATAHRYRLLVDRSCRQLLGPRYALLGPEYAQLHSLVPPRAALRRVLVFFGGADQSNICGRAVEALQAPDLAHLAVDVVLGMQSPHRPALAEQVARRPGTTLHDSLPSLAGLITRADLAIGAGGITTWERACLGLPTLAAAITDNQILPLQALSAATAMPKLDMTDIRQSILEQVKRILDNPESLGSVSKRLSSLVSGEGCMVVAKYICDSDA